MHSQQPTDKGYNHTLFCTSNSRQSLCFAINELEELVKQTPTDNNVNATLYSRRVEALELLKQALLLL